MTALPRLSTDSSASHPRDAEGPVRAPVPDLEELHAISHELERQPATAAIEWAWDRYGSDLVLAASFQDCVLIDLAASYAGAVRAFRVPR